MIFDTEGSGTVFGTKFDVRRPLALLSGKIPYLRKAVTRPVSSRINRHPKSGNRNGQSGVKRELRLVTSGDQCWVRGWSRVSVFVGLEETLPGLVGVQTRRGRQIHKCYGRTRYSVDWSSTETRVLLFN